MLLSAGWSALLDKTLCPALLSTLLTSTHVIWSTWSPGFYFNSRQKQNPLYFWRNLTTCYSHTEPKSEFLVKKNYLPSCPPRQLFRYALPDQTSTAQLSNVPKTRIFRPACYNYPRSCWHEPVHRHPKKTRIESFSIGSLLGSWD